VDLKSMPTADLVAELKTRADVKSVDVMVEDYYQISTEAGRDRINGEGPVVILAVKE